MGTKPNGAGWGGAPAVRGGTGWVDFNFLHRGCAAAAAGHLRRARAVVRTSEEARLGQRRGTRGG
jgi:hypothetical protein